MSDELVQSSIGMRCLVLSKDNQFLFMGRVVHYDAVNTTVRIEEYNRRPLPKQIIPETEIKAHVKYGSDSNQFLLLDGIAVQTTRNSILLAVSCVAEKTEARDYFRQNVQHSAQIALVNQEPANHNCTIQDVSATGIALRSEHVYEIGDHLLLSNQKLRDAGPAHTLECVIVRTHAINEHRRFYGCKFINLRPAQEDLLFQDIFALQAAELR